MHRVEKVFALRVNAHTQALALASQTLLQLGGAFTCARAVGDDHHRELSLDHGLVDIDDAATRIRQYL